MISKCKGKVVLVRRGSCPFVKKAEMIQSAGGAAMVLGGVAPFVVRMVLNLFYVYMCLYFIDVFINLVFRELSLAGRG